MLLAAFEPLSIQTLTTLRRYSAHEDDDDVVLIAIVSGLGSLLSNATSTDLTLPIVPLHTSFRDFLTNEQSSGPFYIDLGEAHRQLVHSCLGLMLGNLKFNICELPSSYYPNDKIDRPSMIREAYFICFILCLLFLGRPFGTSEVQKTCWFKFDRSLTKNSCFGLKCLASRIQWALLIPALSSLNVWLASGQGIEVFS
jgi:hypothetical protein